MGGSVCLPGGRWGRWAWRARSERVPSEPPQFSGRKPCGGPSTAGRVTVTTGPESCPALRHRLTPHRPKGGDGQRPSARGWVHKRVRPQRGVSRSRDKQRRLPLPRRGWKLGTRGLVGGHTSPQSPAPVRLLVCSEQKMVSVSKSPASPCTGRKHLLFLLGDPVSLSVGTCPRPTQALEARFPSAGALRGPPVPA